MINKKILVIDDDLIVRTLLNKILASEGYAVFTAKDGDEGLKELKINRPQLILLELKIPPFSGIDFLKKLKELNIIPVSVILISSFASDEEIKRCYELGIRSFLRKPLNIQELCGLISQCFQMDLFSIKMQQQIKEKEKLNSLMQDILNNMSEGVLALDDKLKIKFISNKGQKIIECKNKNFLNQSAVKFIGSKVAGINGIFHNFQKDNLSNIEINTKLLCISGSIVPVVLSIKKIAAEASHNNIEWLLLFKDMREDEDYFRRHAKRLSFGKMISYDPIMIHIFGMIKKVAKTRSSILVEGETGTGKELIANEIHNRSKFAQGPFHAVNCAAIPANLLESEFFGHERGAFTGADKTKLGRFELADKGTLFLDEIGEIPMELQPKLLRAIQEQKFERVGGTKIISVNIRIVSATNQNLKMMVKEGKFREDLFYRLNVIPIKLPPLRERLSDISHLVSLFVKQLNDQELRNVTHISPEALQLMIRHSWPGNVRELYHAVEFAFAISGDVSILKPKHFRDKIDAPDKPEKQRENKLLDEKELILNVLNQTNFHKGKAAAFLGYHPSTLYRKMKRYKL